MLCRLRRRLLRRFNRLRLRRLLQKLSKWHVRTERRDSALRCERCSNAMQAFAFSFTYGFTYGFTYHRAQYIAELIVTPHAAKLAKWCSQ